MITIVGQHNKLTVFRPRLPKSLSAYGLDGSSSLGYSASGAHEGLVAPSRAATRLCQQHPACTNLACTVALVTPRPSLSRVAAVFSRCACSGHGRCPGALERRALPADVWWRLRRRAAACRCSQARGWGWARSVRPRGPRRRRRRRAQHAHEGGVLVLIKGRQEFCLRVPRRIALLRCSGSASTAAPLKASSRIDWYQRSLRPSAHDAVVARVQAGIEPTGPAGQQETPASRPCPAPWACCRRRPARIRLLAASSAPSRSAC